MNIQAPGSFSRRRVIAGAACALPLAAVLKDPRLAKAAADSLETVTLATAGGLDVSAALALPAAAKAPAVVLIHEWWGLNDQIKTVAAEMAQQGYVALAIDLYGGKVGATPDEAKALMGGVANEAAVDTLVSWVAWLRGHERGSGKVGTVGWCFGGGWSINTALATPTDACIVYYGRLPQSAAELAPLACPVLGHFGTQDQFINKAMVDGFLAAAQAAGKEVTAYWYEANHAFANPSGGNYDAEDAALAWARTTDYLKQRLG
jgi:carboxymethylenebutenolidase